MSSCGSNTGMETSAPLINTIVNNALFHSNLLKRCLKSFTPCILILVDSLPQIDFVMKYIELRVVEWLEIWNLIRVSYITAPSDWRQ